MYVTLTMMWHDALCDYSCTSGSRVVYVCVIIDVSSPVSETEAGLRELMSLFPVDAYEGSLPPIVLKHQLYSILHDRTLVDRQLVHIHTYTYYRRCVYAFVSLPTRHFISTANTCPASFH